MGDRVDMIGVASRVAVEPRSWPDRMQTKPIQMIDEAREALQEVRGGLIELYRRSRR